MNSAMYDFEGWMGETMGRRESLLKLKRYALLYRSFAALLRSNIEDASVGIDTLKASPSSPYDSTFLHLLHLLEGSFHQFRGQLDQAIQSYRQIPPEANDIHILSLLNTILLLRTDPSPHQQSRAKRFLDEVERRFSIHTPSPQLTAAYNLVKGITTTEILLSQFIPLLFCGTHCSEFLNRTVQMATDQANTQLKMLAYGVITSRYYINTSTEQAEKAGLAVYVGAKKAKDELWLLVCGNILAGIPFSQLTR